MSTVTYPHIEVRSNGTLYIVGTPFKVQQLVLDHVAWGWDAAQIQREHPPLTLGQAHAALGYYYDHKDELDREIAEGVALAEEMRDKLGESPLLAKARAAGWKLPGC